MNYEIVEKIGEGGMGAVYRATDKLGQIRAVKVIHPELAHDTGLRERFTNEGKTLAAIGRHPNITALWGLLEENNYLFIVMDYVEGEDVERKLKRNGALSVAEALPLFSQILSAIAYAHQQGIIHRDVKPSNILIESSGQIRVMDFGIARIKGGPRSTKVGVPGTPEYMAPELFAEQTQGANELTDIYALGVTLYEMLTAALPFESSATDTNAAYVAIAQKHLKGKPRRPSELVPGLDKEVERVIMKAIAKEPKDRFQTVPEFSQAIDQQVGRLDISAAGQAQPGGAAARGTMVETPLPGTPVVGGGESAFPLWAVAAAWAVAAGIGFLLGRQLP
ncbi:MAG: serine/threonine protein kinase [Candidatus Handelsmanbacteria bacterium]|nr:serine/threonine protein kinase [Candidatus Handelsmanbacteria bacterium]